MKINNQASLFDLEDYSSDRPIADYDWENSELDRIYHHPPPQKSSPDDTRSILKICEWMRAQPNGGNLDLPEIREQFDRLLPNLQPPILQEHFKSLLPNLENGEQNGEQNREQFKSLLPNLENGEQIREQNREQSKSLLPILKPPQQIREQNREQIKTDPPRSPLLQIDSDRQIVKINGKSYKIQSTKMTEQINRLNGWLDVKPSANKRNLYLCLRWREGSTQRSRHLGKVIPLDAA
jgi:hypothetical protein